MRRSRRAAKPSSANGGSSIAPSPTAWRRQENACSPLRVCRRANGAACAPPMQSSGCTKSSSEGSKRKPCCRQQTPQPCCSGRCSPLDRSTCARSMDGRHSSQNLAISRLTSQPETIPSCSRRMRHAQFQPLPGRHHQGRRKLMVVCGSRELNKRRRLTQEILSTDHFTFPAVCHQRRRHYAGIGHLFQTESTKVNLRAAWCAPEDTSFRKCSGFKLGHYKIQLRPLMVKTGQHPPAKKNILRTENK